MPLKREKSNKYQNKHPGLLGLPKRRVTNKVGLRRENKATYFPRAL